MVYKYEFKCKKCGFEFTRHKLCECPACGSYGVEVIEREDDFKFECYKCGEGFDKSTFGLTVVCDACYRIAYRQVKKNYADSGHWYPWNIDGSVRKYPGKVVK